MQKSSWAQHSMCTLLPKVRFWKPCRTVLLNWTELRKEISALSRIGCGLCLRSRTARKSMGWSHNCSLLCQESMEKFKKVNSTWAMVWNRAWCVSTSNLRVDLEMCTDSWPREQERSFDWDSVIWETKMNHCTSMIIMMLMVVKRRRTRKLLLKPLRILLARTCTQESKRSATCAGIMYWDWSKRRCQEGRRAKERVQGSWFSSYWHRKIFGFRISWETRWRIWGHSKILWSRGKHYWVYLKHGSLGDSQWSDSSDRTYFISECCLGTGIKEMDWSDLT